MRNDPGLRMRGVYNAHTHTDKKLKYIGSSYCQLEELTKNHRGPRYPANTKFRKTLRSEGKEWKFSWFIEMFYCDLVTIEALEGNLIRKFQPELNIDMDPVWSSIKNGRNTPEQLHALSIGHYGNRYVSS